MTLPRAYLEHVAIRVKDIDWHVRFFREVLGLGIRDQKPAAATSRARSGSRAACS